MHTVHYAPKDGNSPFIAAVIGVIFDTTRFDASIPKSTIAIIDAFFDAHLLEDLKDPISKDIPFAKLMNSIDTNNRWVYNGSLTTPPCTKNIYWNVAATIYPIQAKHLTLFRDMLARGDNKLKETGNFRVTGILNNHNPVYISDTVLSVSEI